MTKIFEIWLTLVMILNIWPPWTRQTLTRPWGIFMCLLRGIFCHDHVTAWIGSVPTNLGGDGELVDDDSHRVGVLGQFPGAGQLHHLFVGVSGVGQQGFGVPQTLDQRLDLIEVSLFPEQLGLLEVTRQRQLWRPQEVEDVAETTGVETESVQTADKSIKSEPSDYVRRGVGSAAVQPQLSFNAFWLLSVSGTAMDFDKQTLVCRIN